MSGRIGWMDLTVDDAEGVRDFYARVAGWRPEPVDMGDYADFNMLAQDEDDPVAGVCHARGANAGLPPSWIIYITVDDLDAAVAEAKSLGGAVILETRGSAGEPRFAVLRDPGAAFALAEMP
jgi:predicted enzyme related to lactoylglutathione lyase